MNPRKFAPWAQRLLPILLVGILLMLVYLVLTPFLASVAWAGILAHVTWPLFQRFQIWMGGRHTLCALLMVGGLGTALVLPLLWLIILLQDDVIAGYHVITTYLAQETHPLPHFIIRIPWFGAQLQDWLNTHVTDPSELKQYLAEWFKREASQLLAMLGGIGRNTAKVVFALLTLFFFYRDGETILHQLRLVLRSLIGPRVDAYLNTAGEMSRTVVQSVILAALAQGMISALGYFVIGISAPVLLGFITALSSVIPLFGTFLVWGSISIWLLISGHHWQALALFAWGSLLNNPTDNLIRPLLISNAMRTPLLFVMFGVLGGIAAFGLVGLFLGPVILAVAIAVWNEWIQSIEKVSESSDLDKIQKD